MNSLCMNARCTPEELTELIRKKLLRQYGRDPNSANKAELYKATCLVIRDIMSELQLQTYVEGSAHQKKELYYLSMEFLPGTSLRNNVFNLGLCDALDKAISTLG